MEDNILNGFEAIFDTLGQNGNKEDNLDAKKVIESNEGLTDEELDLIKNINKKPVESKEEEEEEVEEVPAPVTRKKKTAPVVEIEEEEEEEDDTESEGIDDHETKMVTGFFDALSEKIGWDSNEEGEEKPKTVEELISYFQEVIEENSTPEYANDEMAKLDEYVRNGGDIRDYLSIDKDLSIDDMDLSDEVDQKAAVKELLREKGFAAKQIDKKVARYEEAGVLEDEAEDAIEELKEIRQRKKEKLLADQQKAAEASKEKQQEFFTSVVSEIKGMSSIRGINIPEKDKTVLLEYIFKPDTDGRTKYQKDYAKNIKNLIESAYFTMKGDALVASAKNDGKKDAINSFKSSLKNNSGISKKSKKEIKTTDDSLWSSFTRQLRVA